MPKVCMRDSNKTRLYVREFPGEFRVNPNGELFCQLCCTTVNCDKRFRVESHRATSKHTKKLADAKDQKPAIQSFLPTSKNDFKSKLVETFLAADIPLYKLNNPRIKQLFTDLGQPMPSESSCRAHVDVLASKEMQRIKACLHGKTIFLVIDESEIEQKKYFNILVGDTAAPETTYVADCSIVETVNQQIVATKIDDVLRKLDVERNNFVLLLSDAARYMTACTATLKLLYPRLFHVTCMAHLLHNCAEKVRGHFADVDNLIACVKALTVKNKFRRSQFAKIGSPPQPVVTRWGSWLSAAGYYAENLLEVRKIVNSFEGDGVLVTTAKAAVNSDSVATSLVKIQRDYMEMPQYITKMENSKYSIQKAYTDITDLDLEQDCVKIMPYIRKRMEKNSDVKSIMEMKRDGVCPALFAKLQCCQPTSAAVERSFSILGKLLRKDRHFLPCNVAKYLCIHFNK